VGATARRKREMNTLRRWKQRVERLEQKTGPNPGPQMIYLTPNLQPEGDDSSENPWSVKIAPGIWAKAFGAPFTAEQIDNFRKEYEPLSPAELAARLNIPEAFVHAYAKGEGSGSDSSTGNDTAP